MKKPRIIDFHKVESNLGDLSIIEFQKHIDFEIKRVFFLDNIQTDDIQRGFHAHKTTEQLLICLYGEINFYSELSNGERFDCTLTTNSQGVYIPANSWHHMTYKRGTIQLVCASQLYDESDYLRTKDSFLDYYKNKL